MHFNLTDEQVMVRASAERLVKQFGALERRRERISRSEGDDGPLWTQMVELGWPALCVPEAEGGVGGSMTDIALLLIELGKGLCTSPLLGSALQCARLLADSQWPGRNAWVERVMFEGSRLAFAHLEPGDRIEAAAPGGTHYEWCNGRCRLTGQKLLVLDGDGVDAYLVTAISANRSEPLIALVPATATGLLVQAYPLIDGTRAVDLQLAAVELDEAYIVASGANAQALIEQAQARVTVGTLAAAVGSMEACLELCSDYLKVRTQFGQPIGKFQALQHSMADMLVEAHNARSMLYYALSRFDGPREEREAAISAAKLIIGQAGLMVSSTGIQLHGGYGLTDEFAIGHHHRFLCKVEKCHGDSQAHARILGDHLLGDLHGSENATDRHEHHRLQRTAGVGI